MIKIEMSFANVEQAIAWLARKDESIFTQITDVKVEPAPGVYTEEQLQPKAEAPKEEKPSSPSPAESAAPGVTYDDLKASIMKLVAKSPAQMKEVCEAFGLKTFAGTTDPVLWAKAKAMIDAKVAG